MTERGHHFLRHQYRIANGAMTAFGLARLGASRLDRGVYYRRMVDTPAIQATEIYVTVILQLIPYRAVGVFNRSHYIHNITGLVLVDHDAGRTRYMAGNLFICKAISVSDGFAYSALSCLRGQRLAKCKPCVGP